MSTAVPVYRKVRGGGLAWSGRGGLWLAQDHLLEVSSAIVLEQYRRFFFHDARAFVVQRTNGRFVWGWVLGGFGLAFALVTALSWWIGMANKSEDWHAAFYVLAGFFGLVTFVLLALWIINLALGPSCRCHLLTATGWHALSAPRRLAPAGRAQVEIAATIQTAQGPPPVPEPDTR